jgi:MFS transporter, DHA1 family, multidrug resistance protein
MWPVKSTSITFTLVLGTFVALPPLGIDMSLPGLPAIAVSLHTSVTLAGATLSLFLVGYATGPVLFAPLSDGLGRRPVLLLGVTLFGGAGFLCSIAPSIEWLLLGRFAQGMGAGIGAALPLAIVRDLFDGAAARERLSHITIVFSLGPLLAPALGSIVIPVAGWRGIYFVNGLIGVLLLLLVVLVLAESLPRERRRNLDPGELAADYRQTLSHGVTVGYSLVNAFSYACMFAFISGSPLVLITGRGLSPAAFSAVFAWALFGLISGAFIGGRLARHGIPSSRVLLIGVAVGGSSTVTLLGLSLMRWDALMVMMPFLPLSAAAYGLTGPTAVHEALVPVQPIAGLAAGVLRSIQIVTGAVACALVPVFYSPHSSAGMTAVMAACALSAFLVYMLYARRASATFASAVPAVQPSRPAESGS